MFCPQCGKQIPDTSKVCGFCGHQIVRVSAPPPPPPVEIPVETPVPQTEPVREKLPEPETAEKDTMKKQKKKPAEKSKKKPESKAKARSAKPPKEKRVKNARVKPIPWKWIAPGIVVAVLLAFLVLVYIGVIPLVGLQQTLALYLPSPGAEAANLSCKTNNETYVEVRSSWLENRVRIDGKISSPGEWADATCTSSIFRVPDYSNGLDWGDGIPAQWWIKNDGKWVYLLVRVSSRYGEPGGVFFNHFWPGPYVDGWAHSDGAGVTLDGKASDIHGWDEKNWKDDTDYGGSNDVVGAVHQDESYYWFELKKPLDSGDGLDWDWRAGGSTGQYNGTLIGFWGLVDDLGGYQLDSLITFAVK